MLGNCKVDECIQRELRWEVERLHRLLQWCKPRLPEQYRAGLERMIENPTEPDHTPIAQSST